MKRTHSASHFRPTKICIICVSIYVPPHLHQQWPCSVRWPMSATLSSLPVLRQACLVSLRAVHLPWACRSLSWGHPSLRRLCGSISDLIQVSAHTSPPHIGLPWYMDRIIASSLFTAIPIPLSLLGSSQSANQCLAHVWLCVCLWSPPSSRTEVPDLFGTRDRFRGRQLFHRLGGCGGMVSGWFKRITCIVHFISIIITL